MSGLGFRYKAWPRVQIQIYKTLPFVPFRVWVLRV